MKKILLTSSFVNVNELLIPLLGREAKNTRVAFIPTAADAYEDKWFVDKDRNALIEMGLIIKDVFLHNTEPETLKAQMEDIDVVFVAGGNTFYLLQESRKSGFTQLMPKLLEAGVIYVGSSAGSYIACPTIETANWEPRDENDVGLMDLTAMSLVPFLLAAHYEPGYKEGIATEKVKITLPIHILTDNQALQVIDGAVTLVGTGPEIKI